VRSLEDGWGQVESPTLLDPADDPYEVSLDEKDTFGEGDVCYQEAGSDFVLCELYDWDDYIFNDDD